MGVLPSVTINDAIPIGRTHSRQAKVCNLKTCSLRV
jgi:hypothetical protein